MKAVILAGGYGKRLRPLTETTPKPLIPVADRPIIEWQIRWLKHYGIEDFIICAGYLKEKIVDDIGSGHKLDVKVGYVVEDVPLGTGGALKNAEHLLSGDDLFIVLNGDIITNLNPLVLAERVSEKENAVGGIALIHLPSPYGIIEFDRETGVITRFVEKPRLQQHYINAGVYAFKSSIFSYLPEEGDIERSAFPQLADERKLIAVTYEEVEWISIDSYKDLEEAAKLVKRLPGV
ncbi:MAG TPA: nucleotidyltransferase family protein [Candidatus Caldiarchaeum subterraneum]|uniref:Nucleotidyltransferase family protein n=1 Tax=Caldiarchaeum subterraneum TaxID=311458 RepID=A0A832ZVW0_CALS0|nr:nucleotidyltransferase family protein [Candidatus Caldarchaeum subterraneum]